MIIILILSSYNKNQINCQTELSYKTTLLLKPNVISVLVALDFHSIKFRELL